MSEIPQVTLEQLKMSLDNGVCPSVEIIDEDGKYLYTAIVPSMEGGMTIYDEIRTQADYLGLRGNTVLNPKIIEAITMPVFAIEKLVATPLVKAELPKRQYRQRRKRQVQRAKGKSLEVAVANV